MQKWCLGCNFIVANTQLSLFYLEIFVARLLRGGVLQNNDTDNQRVTQRNNPTKYGILGKFIMFRKTFCVYFRGCQAVCGVFSFGKEYLVHYISVFITFT